MMFWHIEHPKARKAHRCEMCSRIIDPGEAYLSGVAHEDSWWTWNECAHCEAVRRIYDIVWDDGYNADTYAEWAGDPRDVTELRHAAGYRMKWRTRSGKLLPIPERTKP